MNDGVDEPNELFSFHLRRTLYLNPRMELDPADGQIEIFSGEGKLTN